MGTCWRLFSTGIRLGMSFEWYTFLEWYTFFRIRACARVFLRISYYTIKSPAYTMPFELHPYKIYPVKNKKISSKIGELIFCFTFILYVIFYVIFYVISLRVSVGKLYKLDNRVVEIYPFVHFVSRFLSCSVFEGLLFFCRMDFNWMRDLLTERTRQN